MDVKRRFVAVANYCVFGCLLVPLLIGLCGWFSQPKLERGRNTINILIHIYVANSRLSRIAALAGIVVLFSALVILVGRRVCSVIGKHRAFLLFVFGAAVCGSIISIVCIDPVQPSDFQHYHRATVAMIQSGNLAEFLANYPTCHARRALFIVYPLYRVFGANTMVIQIANGVYHILTGVCVYWLARILCDRRTALGAVGFYFLIPVQYLMLNLVSHDIPGLFWTSLLLLILARTVTRLRQHESRGFLLVLAVLAGGVLFIVARIRVLQLPFVLSMFAATLLYLTWHLLQREDKPSVGTAVKRALCFCVVPLLLYGALNRCIFPLNRDGSAVTYGALLFANSDTGASGEFLSSVPYRHSYGVQLDTDEESDYGTGRLGSELYYHGGHFVRMLARKVVRLYSIGDDMFWVTGPKGAYSMPVPIVLFFWLSGYVMRLAITVCAALGVARAMQRNHLNMGLSMVGFFCLSFTALLTLSEVQPRYLYALHGSWSLFAAIGFSGIRTARTMEEKPHLARGVKLCLAGWTGLLLGAGLVALLCYAVFAGVWHGSDYRFVDLKEAELSGPCRLLSLTETEEHMKLGLVPAFLNNGETRCSALWRKKVTPRLAYVVRLFLRTRIDAPDNVQISLLANGRKFLVKKISEMAGRPLTGAPDYRVTFVKSEPVYVERDAISIELVVSSRNKVSGDDCRAAEVYVDFMQIMSVAGTGEAGASCR